MAKKDDEFMKEDDRLAAALTQASFRRLNLDEDVPKRPPRKKLSEKGIPEENLKATYWG